MKAGSKGFTLVEIMLVAAVLSALATGAGLVGYVKARQTAQTNLCKENRRSLEHAEQLYALGEFGHSVAFQDLVDRGYLRSVPACPSKGTYAWAAQSPSDPLYRTTVGCSIHGTSLPVASLASDDFNDGNYNGWSLFNAKKWAVSDGAFIAGNSDPRIATGENRAFFGDTAWKDYSVTLDATLWNGPGYGVYFRATNIDAVNGYCFQYDPGWNPPNGAFIVRKVTNGNESSPIATYNLPAGYNWRGAEKQVTVSVSGNTFKAYVSDINGGSVPVLTATDSTYKTGAVGLRTWSNSYASFDNINVKTD